MGNILLFAFKFVYGSCNTYVQFLLEIHIKYKKYNLYVSPSMLANCKNSNLQKYLTNLLVAEAQLYIKNVVNGFLTPRYILCLIKFVKF